MVPRVTCEQYLPLTGLRELREAVAGDQQRRCGISSDPDREIIITSGGRRPHARLGQPGRPSGSVEPVPGPATDPAPMALEARPPEVDQRTKGRPSRPPIDPEFRGSRRLARSTRPRAGRTPAPGPVTIIVVGGSGRRRSWRRDVVAGPSGHIAAVDRAGRGSIGKPWISSSGWRRTTQGGATPGSEGSC